MCWLFCNENHINSTGLRRCLQTREGSHREEEKKTRKHATQNKRVLCLHGQRRAHPEPEHRQGLGAAQPGRARPAHLRQVHPQEAARADEAAPRGWRQVRGARRGGGRRRRQRVRARKARPPAPRAPDRQRPRGRRRVQPRHSRGADPRQHPVAHARGSDSPATRQKGRAPQGDAIGQPAQQTPPPGRQQQREREREPERRGRGGGGGGRGRVRLRVHQRGGDHHLLLQVADRPAQPLRRRRGRGQRGDGRSGCDRGPQRRHQTPETRRRPHHPGQRLRPG